MNDTGSYDDLYFYPGTKVLKNLLGIRDKETLAKAEADIVAINMQRIAERPISGPFDLARLKETHRRIFEGLYDFAGEFRRNVGPMAKTRDYGAQVKYPDPTFVPNQIEHLLGELGRETLRGLDADRFASKLAHYYAELDAAHGFPEGNSRTLRMFTADLARANGYQLEWAECIRTPERQTELYKARDKGVMQLDSSDLARVMRGILSPAPMEKEQAQSKRKSGLYRPKRERGEIER